MLKKISLVLLVILYVSAGVNHFMNPQSYIAIIPPYLPYPSFINLASGMVEIALGILLIFSATRRVAAIGIVILLALFIPAHIYMIQKGGCINETICWPAWAAWVRLFPLQFILMWWAWCHKK